MKGARISGGVTKKVPVPVKVKVKVKVKATFGY